MCRQRRRQRVDVNFHLPDWIDGWAPRGIFHRLICILSETYSPSIVLIYSILVRYSIYSNANKITEK